MNMESLTIARTELILVWDATVGAYRLQTYPPSTSDDACSHRADFIEEVRNAISALLKAGDFSSPALAQRLGYNQMTLTRMLFRLSGKSIMELAMEVRLDQAMELLKSGRLSLGEIQQRVGIRSTSYFILQFRNRFGLSPHEFQRQWRRLEQEGRLAAQP